MSGAVVHVLPTVDDHFGGPGPVLAGWLEAAAEAGGRAAVFATATGPGRTASRLAAIAEVDFAPPGRSLGRWYGNRWQLQRIAAASREADVVVSHSFFHLPALVAGWAAIRAGVPWVVAPHGSLDPWDVHHHHAGIKWLLTPVWRWFLNRCVLWCITGREAELVVTFGAAPRREIVTCPVEPAAPTTVADALSRLRTAGTALDDAVHRGGLVVSYVGRFDRKKGVERLIRAFDDAAGEHDVLVLAGRGDDYWTHRVNAAVACARRASQIRQSGWLDSDGKRALWSLPGVFALTSDNENFGVAVAEAMAYGRPVLLTDRVALADDVSRYEAGVVTGLDDGEVATGLARLLTDPALRARAAAGAHALVRHELSPPVVAAAYERALGRLVPTRHITLFEEQSA